MNPGRSRTRADRHGDSAAVPADQQPRSLRRTDPLPAFFGLAFCISWGVWISMIVLDSTTETLQIVGACGPSVAAALVAFGAQGRFGVYRLGRGWTRWRVELMWYLAALGPVAAVVLGVIGGLAVVTDDRLVRRAGAGFAEVLLLIVVAQVAIVLGQETGWRGFALPRLQARTGPLRASMLLGLTWAVWHLPLYLIPGSLLRDIPFELLVVQGVSLAVGTTWLYNRTGGSIVPGHLFHAGFNVVVRSVPLIGIDRGDRTVALVAATAVLAAFAGGIAAARLTARRRRAA